MYSMLDERRPLPDIIRTSKDYLVHFHANDDNMLGPGFGNVDFKQIMNALREIATKVSYLLRSLIFSPSPQRIATVGLETLKRALFS